MMMRQLTILCICVWAASAVAKEPPRADLEKARAHFKTAEGLFRSGAYERAIDEYQAAYGLAPRPGVLFNIGAAYRKKAEGSGSIEDKKQALDYYRKYVEGEPEGKGTADAKRYIATLSQEIAASSQTASTEPPSRPGHVEPQPVSAPSSPSSSPPSPPPPPPPSPVAESPPVTAPASESGTSALRVAGIATAGVGVALVATGVYFGIKSKSISDEVDGLHNWDQGLYESGQSAQRNAYIFVAGGAAAIAGGAIMYFLGHRDEPHALSVRPSVMPQGGTVVLSGRF